MGKSTIMTLSPKEKQMCAIWEGTPKQFGKSFCIMTSAEYTYVLYVDGARMKVFSGGMPIYPFSENPEKKPSFFQRKKVYCARLVCVASGHVFQGYWGTRQPWIVMDAVGNHCAVGAVGEVYFEVGRPENDILRFENLLMGLQDFDMDSIWAQLRDVFTATASSAFCVALDENHISLDDKDLTASEKLAISRSMYGRMKNIFEKFGIYITSESEYTILSNMIVHNH